MIEPERTSKYRKSVKQELYLKRMNSLLSGFEEQLISKFNKPRLPTIFIVGVPRSGSTLLGQIMAQTGAFSCISNFVARFWMAPYLGMLIEQALDVQKRESQQAFHSSFGTTEGWAGPHEFGYFWSRWFEFDEVHKLSPKEVAKINRSELCKEIAALESIYKKPLFFKNLTCGLQITFLAELLEKSFFVLCRRHTLYNMQSLLLARQEIFGDKEYWWSLRPKEYFKLI